MDFVILVGSCDKYHYLWNHFNYLFHKYWDNSIDVKKYIITQETDARLHKFETIKVKNGTFSIGVKKAIDKIKPKNILWLQDSAGRFGIHDDSAFYAKLPVYKNIYKFHQQSLYTISLQASFWNTNFLYSCFDKDNEEDPWQFEVEGSERLNKNCLHRIFFAMQEKPWYLEACRKGKFTEDFYNICKQEGINANIA
jgi:hypothetical protein